VSIFLGKGDGTFEISTVYAAGVAGRDGDPHGTLAVVGDFNGDGILDLAAINNYAGTVSILLGKGDGTFRAAPCYLPGGGSVAVADFNGDGIPDLAVANSGGSVDPFGSLSILLGNGDGTFQARKSYVAGGNPFVVAVGDFNGDSIPDLVVPNFKYGAGAVSVLLGNGDGTFQAALTMAAGNQPTSVAVGDFNRDGKLDIVTTNFVEEIPRKGWPPFVVGSDLRVVLGNGDGTFQPPQTYAVGPPESAPISVAVGDFNGDGALDLAVTNSGVGTLSIFLGKGDGTFQAAQNQSVGPTSRSVAVGDFNGDGIPDLAVTGSYFSYLPATVKVLLGNGDGTFQAPQAYPVGTGAYWVTTGDFNRDGVLDLAVADVSSGVSVLLGNGDGTFQAAQSYVAGPGGQIGVGDLNNDGYPDLVLSKALTVLLNTP
jgi:hypothetical protein